MVSFQPTFKLMLVSLNLVLLLGLQSTPVLADGLHGAPADHAVRRHAARAGRLSKRFPSVSGSDAKGPSINRRARHHHHDDGMYGLTPSEIDELLAEQEIEDSGIFTPTSNSTDTTSSHTHTRTRKASATRTASSASSSSTSSIESSSSSHSHRSSSSESLPTASSLDLVSTALPDSHPQSTYTHTSYSSTHTSSLSGNSNGIDGLLSSLLSPASTSSSFASHQTVNTDGIFPSATFSSSKPTATGLSSLLNGPFSSIDDQNSNTDDSPSTSKHSQTSQPDFYSFTPHATRSSTSSMATFTSLFFQSQGLASSFSTASPSPTSSPSLGSNSGINSSIDDSSSSSSKALTPANTAVSNSGSDNGSATSLSSKTTDVTSTIDDGTASASATSGLANTVTAGPTPTAITSGLIPTATASTGIDTDSGSSSGSSSDQQSSSNTATGPASALSSSSSSSSGSPSDSSDYGSSTSSSVVTTNPYWYANTRSLNMAPSSTWSANQAAQTDSQSTSDGGDGSTGSSTSTSAGVSSGPAAQDLPTTIVPSADSFEQPADTTPIGLLFKQDMKWTWVISQADLTAQIFAFMPDLVGQSAGLESSKVSTVKLSSYSPEARDTANTSTLSTARTLYMAYVPTSSVEAIQAMVANTSSPFYTSAAAGAPQQLASQVDPTFNILSVAGKVASGSKQSATSGSGGAKDDSTLRNSLIGVGCGLAGCFALVAGGLFWRKQRQGEVDTDGKGDNGVSRAHTIRSFHGGLRETWAPDALDQHRALNTAGEMQQVWSPHDGGLSMGHPSQQQPAMYPHADGFGGYVPSDPFQDAAAAGNAGVAGGYVNMNRSSRMTERSNYSDLSQMTEAQRIQFDYESSRRSFQSTSDHSGSHGSHSDQSAESAGMLSTYQEDYRVPRQHTSIHAFGSQSQNSRSRRRGSVASSIIGRPEMMSNSVLL